MRATPIGINLLSVSNASNVLRTEFEPSSRLTLSANEVHLWRIDLDALASSESRWRSLLCQDELIRADRFHFARDRQNFTVTRAFLRILLGSYIDSDPNQIKFDYGENQKPSLSPCLSTAKVNFNVSHSGGKALLGFARQMAIGVDVEQIRNNFDPDALACRFFSPTEQEALAGLPKLEKTKGFFRCWTRKEAYIKAHGSGLSLPLNQFDVSIEVGESKALLATRPDSMAAALWSIREVDSGPGYVAAVCAKGNGWALRLRDCPDLRPQ